MWTARTVDEGIALLAGIPSAPLHAAVHERLADLAAQARRNAPQPPGEEKPLF